MSLPYRQLASSTLRAYAFVLFLDRGWAGALCVLATLWYPNIGLAGLFSVVVTIIACRLLRMPHEDSGLHILNAMLVGLSLGAFFELNIQLLAIIAIASLLCLFMTTILVDVFWRLGKLPVLTLPFIVVAFSTAFATKSYAGLSPFLDLKLTTPQIITPAIDTFLSSLAAIFFNPHPLAGLLIFLAIIIRSRYLALLCVSGYMVGLVFFNFLAGSHIADTIQWNGFNFSLTAMALGGFYAVPSIPSFIIAMFGAAIAALLTTSLQNFLFMFGLPVMATPFLASTLVIMYALSRRQNLVPPTLVMDEPAIPEQNYERNRIMRVRLGEHNSVPVNPPFYGEWQIYQGFNGRYTHIAPWQYALDFFKLEENQSYRDEGLTLEDYYCFGLPVVSPVYGTVVRVQDSLADNPPGEVDVVNNWGNFILIGMANGLFVLLAHLKHDSLVVKEGDKLQPGDKLAQCGNSGRSPQPHLHMQVQTLASLGAPTYQFHLSGVVESRQQQQVFKLISIPEPGDSIKTTEPNIALRNTLHLPVGRTLSYQFTRGSSEPVKKTLRVELSLLGQFVLRSDSGAQAKFIETEELIAFYDRSGKRDLFLDMWLLCFGITPFSTEASNWSDSLNAALLPLNLWQKFLLAIRHPLGGAIQSQYRRVIEQHSSKVMQSGEHSLDIGLHKVRVETNAVLDIEKGTMRLTLKGAGFECSAELTELGQVEDEGIPSWQQNVH